jgi:hypothetical protein
MKIILDEKDEIIKDLIEEKVKEQVRNILLHPATKSMLYDIIRYYTILYDIIREVIKDMCKESGAIAIMVDNRIKRDTKEILEKTLENKIKISVFYKGNMND